VKIADADYYGWIVISRMTTEGYYLYLETRARR